LTPISIFLVFIIGVNRYFISSAQDSSDFLSFLSFYGPKNKENEVFDQNKFFSSILKTEGT